MILGKKKPEDILIYAYPLPLFFLFFLFFFSLDLLVPGCIISVGSLACLWWLACCRFSFATKLSALKFCIEVDLNVFAKLLVLVFTLELLDAL